VFGCGARGGPARSGGPRLASSVGRTLNRNHIWRPSPALSGDRACVRVHRVLRVGAPWRLRLAGAPLRWRPALSRPEGAALRPHAACAVPAGAWLARRPRPRRVQARWACAGGLHWPHCCTQPCAAPQSPRSPVPPATPPGATTAAARAAARAATRARAWRLTRLDSQPRRCSSSTGAPLAHAYSQAHALVAVTVQLRCWRRWSGVVEPYRRLTPHSPLPLCAQSGLPCRLLQQQAAAARGAGVGPAHWRQRGV